MFKLFDYVYYRLHKFYGKQQSDMTESYSSALVSLVQFMTIVSILFLFTLYIEFQIPSKWMFAPLLIILMIINWYRYERNIDIEELSTQWEEEDPLSKKKKGWLIVAYFAIVILTPVAIGILRHNFGLI